MLLPQGGWQGDWGNAMPVETAFAESYGAPSLGGPYGNPTPGPIAVESSPLGAFNSGSGDTSGAAAPGSGRGPSLGYAAQPSPWGGLPSEINNGYSAFGGLPASIETGRPGAFGSEMNAAPIDIGAQDYGAYGSLNTGPLDKGYGAFGGLPTEIVTGRETPNPFGSLSYGQFSQPNVGINDWSGPASRDFGSFDYSHLDGMDFGGSPASSYGAALGSSPRGSSYNGAFAGQPFDMQGDYGTGGKNSTRAGNVGQYGAPVTTGMTPGFAAPSKGVAFGDEILGDFNSVAPISVSPAVPTGFYDPMTGFSANLSGWGGGGGGDYAGGGFGGGAPGLGGGVMGGDPAMGGGDRGMNRGGQVRRPFAEGGAPQPTERRQEEARPYEPTMRDRLASWMMGDERASPARRAAVEGLTGSTGLGTTGMGLVDVTPAGIPMAVQEARRDAGNNDWLGATLNASAVLPGAKVVTEPAKEALQGAARYIKAYHGSPKTDLTTLLPSTRGPLGPGTYMTPAPNVASRYAGDTGKVYEKNLNADEIFGATRMLNRSDINPYEVWRDQFGRVVEAAPSEIRGDIAKMAEKLDPSDGYPFYNQLARLSGGDDKAQELLRAAKFKGIAGYVDGPEISLFDPQQLAIRAYHGSPHNFDRFSLSKIGTGEGAQAYGHGLYFAENEGVARGYRDTLAKRANQDPSYWQGVELPKSLSVPEQDEMNWLGAAMRQKGNLAPDEMTRWKELRAKKDIYENALEAAKTPGHMYEVAIKADPERFLDWDKPLREQGAAVQDKVWSGLRDNGLNQTMANYLVNEKSGADAYSAMTRGAYEPQRMMLDGGAPRATNTLYQHGLPGIKYLDAGSRTAGDGSRNYVVFDDNLIDIMRKYGLAGAAVGAGAAGVAGQENGRVPNEN